MIEIALYQYIFPFGSVLELFTTHFLIVQVSLSPSLSRLCSVLPPAMFSVFLCATGQVWNVPIEPLEILKLSY